MVNGRILGLDVGGERIGVAISDEMGIIASPLTMIRRNGPVAEEMRKLIRQYAPVLLVVGLPVGLSGREGPQAQSVREFAASLAKDVGLELEYWDERLTTTIAEKMLISHKRNRKQRRDEVDAAAASVILQGYLESKRTRTW